ncbi:MAG: DNA-binding protein [Helicobacteraceae bacterium CG2_30_36_10]|nr:MAG: DNA-binding protein [Helicobacteraceae bacterium CG2_30_36_10]
MKLFALVLFCASLLFGAVDINTADKKELMTLNGLGDKKADTILEYRATNCFEDVNALAKVKGIGPKFLEKNRDNLTASKCKTK